MTSKRILIIGIELVVSYKNVLFLGSNGQIGQALARALTRNNFVVGVDITQKPEGFKNPNLDEYISGDATFMTFIKPLIAQQRPEWVFHLPAILSGTAEKDLSMALKAMRVNVGSFVNILQLSTRHKFRLFCPSTIAAFGPDTPAEAPDTTIMAPKFLYGVTKVHNELVGDYFHRRYGVDYRSLRLPGVIAPSASAGTGTTDYAIELLRAAKFGKYECFLRPKTTLPMIHLNDCVDGIIKVMSVDRKHLTRSIYNVQSMSIDPETLKAEIERQTGKILKITYKPDHRQAIADSWPRLLDDSNARRDWDWLPKYDLSRTVSSILEELGSEKNK